MLDQPLTTDTMLLEAKMGVLDKLKIAGLAKQVKGTIEQKRRKKLAEQLTAQLKFAEAAVGGKAYQRTKAAWDTDAEGHRVRRPVKLRQWWEVGESGAVQFGLRSGVVPLQLKLGKTAVEVTKLADLPVVIKTLLQAVETSAVDAAFAAAKGSRGANPTSLLPLRHKAGRSACAELKCDAPTWCVRQVTNSATVGLFRCRPT